MMKMIKIGKKLYKFYIIFLLCSISNFILSVKIQLTDIGGNKIEKVIAEEPFGILIQHSYSTKNIKGIEQFHVLSQSISTSFINNSDPMFNKFYKLKANKPGQYNLEIESHKNKPNKIFTIVVKDPKVKSEVLLNLDKPEIFVGQKIPVTIKTTYKEDPNREFNRIEAIKRDDIKIELLNDIKIYKDEKDKKIYQVIENYGYIVPQKSGPISLNNFFVVLNRAYLSQNNFFQFKQCIEEKFNTQEIELQVKELPKKVQAVGKFSQFIIEIDKNIVNQEEAIIMTISITGQTDFDRLDKLNLVLPSNIKIFEPKTSIIKKNNQETKKFEYIIQPLKDGIIKIPTQKFYYWEPEKKLVKILKSNALEFKVNPVKNIKHNEIETQDLELQEKVENENDIEKNFEEYIEKIINQNHQNLQLPWLVFISLLILPISWLSTMNRSLLSKYYKKNIQYKFFKNSILNSAIRKVNNAEKKQLPNHLYPILKSTIITYLLKEDKDLTSEEILDILSKYDIDKNIIHEYKELTKELLSYTTYNYTSIKSNKDVYQKTKDFIMSIKANNKFNSIKYCILILFFNSYLISIDKNNMEKNIETLIKLYRAEKYATLKDKIRIKNIINKIKEEAGIITRPIYKNHLEQIKNTVPFYIPLIAWQIIFLIFWTTLILTIFKQKKYFVIKSISFILLTITGLSIAVISQEKSKLKAIVKNQNTNIYIGPDEKYPVKDSIEILNCVEILKEQDFYDSKWYYINAKPNKGWIKSQNLKLIN